MKSYSSLAILMLLAVPGFSHAEELEFKVALEALPGVDEVQAGEIELGVSILESQLASPGSITWQRTIATLCGVYVLAGDYRKANDACETAVVDAPGETAFNNRGVLRVHYGDFVGASEDFDKARPENVSDYLRLIRDSDPRLIAVSNTRSLQDLRVRLDTVRMRESRKIGLAKVENVLN